MAAAGDHFHQGHQRRVSGLTAHLRLHMFATLKFPLNKQKKTGLESVVLSKFNTTYLMHKVFTPPWNPPAIL